jgi:NAD(P)-dependent dehydrogenase (short-subunit alcohol dehydrogenase family)
MNGRRPVLFVSGGSRGIGRSVIMKAVSDGYDVAFTYNLGRREAEAIVADVAAAGAEALALKADVSRQDEVNAAFAAAFERFGRLDGLVNNAAIIGGMRTILEADPDHLASVFSVNVLGAFYCASAASARMSTLRGGMGGAIVNISSAAARHGGLPNEAHYAASKGALDSMTLALAKELPQHGIRINAVRPGIIRTEIHQAHGGEATVETVGASVPLGRPGEPDEVAEVVLFLLGAKSSYVNGAILDVSGGR